RALEARALLGDPRLLPADLFLPFLEPGLRGPDVAFGPVECFARGELLAPEVLLSGQCLLGLLELNPRGLDHLALLIERGFGLVDRRRPAVDACAQRLRVDLQQALASPDASPLVAGQTDDPPPRVAARVRH